MSDENLKRRIEHLESEVRALRAFEAAPYRAVVEDMTELIVRWRPDGTRVFVNDAYCRLFATPREQLLGTSFWPLISERDRHAVRARIEALTPEHPVSTGRHSAVGPDGRVVWMEWTDRALFDAEWNVVEYQSVGRDITERVHIEQQLRRVEQADAVAKASASIAHDLNNLLFVIAGELELANSNRAPANMEAVRTAIEQGKVLLLQLRELRYGRVAQPILFDLNQRVMESLALLREVAGHGVDIEAQVGAQPCRINGDPTQIDQILLNLVKNASEANPDGRILISTALVDRDALPDGHSFAGVPPILCWVLRVSDTAGGIPPGVLKRIFDPHVTTKPQGQGLGLGTVRAVAQSHAGSVRVETSKEGSTFEVAFPAAT